MSPRNEQIRQDVLESIGMGQSIPEITTLLDISASYLYELLKQLTRTGKIIKVGKGKYELVTAEQAPISLSPPYNGNGNSQLAERSQRKVQLPDYMKTRIPITLFVEHSPEELEGVMRLELCIGGNWIPLPTTGDLRVCVGDDIPRWSATQEVYSDVKAFRVTRRDGTQAEYPHNPAVPITVDAK